MCFGIFVTVFNIKFMAWLRGLSCTTPLYGDLFPSAQCVIFALISENK